MPYEPNEIEPKIQKYWDEIDAFRAADESKKPKAYILDMFPYPSGDGLHVGHPIGYFATDIVSRYKRMKGFEVLHPMGWDSFGLPAENYAIKVNIHPRLTTDKNTKNFKRQMKMLGLSYDWSREVDTSSEEYYKWSQWFFLFLYKQGLAYRKEAPVNWCDVCQTVLANDQVVDGKCERSKNPVVQKMMLQWFFKVTEYADRLLHDLDALDWPESLKDMQRNWIGRSEGAYLEFAIDMSSQNHSSVIPAEAGIQNLRARMLSIKVFTTRPDTLYGVTYLVLAPEHPLVSKIVTKEQKKEVDAYVEAAKHRSDLERTGLNQEKTGVFSGSFAVHPITGEKVPVWIADYVLSTYGTGAVMAVPAHDERDWAFAKKYDLPVKQVIWNPTAPIKSYLMGAADITEDDLKSLGIEIVSSTKDGDRKIIIPLASIKQYEKLIEQKLTPGFWNEYVGQETVFLFKTKDGKVQRHVLSSETESFIDKLAAEFMGESWKNTNVWKWLAENDWYKDNIIHFVPGVLINSDKHDGLPSAEAANKITKAAKGKKAVTYRIRDWLVSRQRFWGAPIPIIYCDDCGIVPVPEDYLPVKLPKEADFTLKGDGKSPLARVEDFVNTACPQCNKPAKRETDTMDGFVDNSWYFFRFTDPHNPDEFAAKDRLKRWMPVDLYVGGAEHAVGHLIFSRFFTKVLYDRNYISFQEPFHKLVNQGLILAEDGQKMSKSLGNVINPDQVVKDYGADALRMYEMFLGPLNEAKPWDTKGINGVRRFLDRVERFFMGNAVSEKAAADATLTAALHKTIKKVTEDIENLRFNTAISAMMIFMNAAQDKGALPTVEGEVFLKILSPFAPHLAEHLWHETGHTTSITKESWPTHDERLVQAESVTMAVQINGKTRATIEVAAEADEAAVKEMALAQEAVKKHLADKPIKKVVFVKGRIINLIV